MNQALTALYDLQQVDSALAAAHRKYQSLDPGRAEQAAAESARTLYERITREHHNTATDLKDSELELQAVETKKQNFETKLYGGQVQAPKELQAMEAEIEALGRQRSRLDDRILTLMEQVETRRAEEREAKRNLEAAETALASKQAEHKAAAQDLARRIQTLTTKRATLAKPIPAALIARYDSIRAAKGGVGIGRIENGNCSACQTNLPSNVMRKVEDTDALETCFNCGRLLCMTS